MPLKYPNISLSDFELLDTLGTGSFGRVRLVKYANAQPADGLYFALKILKKSEVIYLKQVEHVKTEKKLLETIQHPFIVNLLACVRSTAARAGASGGGCRWRPAGASRASSCA